jgi:hypothetical protein
VLIVMWTVEDTLYIYIYIYIYIYKGARCFGFGLDGKASEASLALRFNCLFEKLNIILIVLI